MPPHVLLDQGKCPVGRSSLIALATLFAMSFGAGDARGDDKQACSDAYAQTQTLRAESKLEAARQQALLCMKDACAEFVRTDCTKWLGEIESSQPTVVLEVRDAKGQDVLDAKIDLDGKPWLANVDIKAHPIDPGPHTIKVTSPHGQAEKSVLLREGSKNVTVSLQLAQAPAAPAPASPPPSDAPPATAPPDEHGGGRSPLPFIVGGTGLVIGAVGAVLGIVVIGEKSTFDDNCVAAEERCNATAGDARETGETLGPISTVLMITGAAAVGVAVVLFATDDGGAESARVETGPVVGRAGGGWRVGGSF